MPVDVFSFDGISLAASVPPSGLHARVEARYDNHIAVHDLVEDSVRETREQEPADVTVNERACFGRCS